MEILQSGMVNPFHLNVGAYSLLALLFLSVLNYGYRRRNKSAFQIQEEKPQQARKQSQPLVMYREGITDQQASESAKLAKATAKPEEKVSVPEFVGSIPTWCLPTQNPFWTWSKPGSRVGNSKYEGAFGWVNRPSWW